MSTAEAENKPQQESQLPSRHPSAYKQVRTEIRQLPCSREENKDGKQAEGTGPERAESEGTGKGERRTLFPKHTLSSR